ncbi:MAG TPA: hypothetical protein VHG51_12230 [Longimicrobiaceae bacterium]|nr:hypothetical protein [Longimicrobiaceae bacterium]
MANPTCPTCGGELHHPSARCADCGDRPRTRSPYPWQAEGARRSAVFFGILITLLILAALAWTLADSRRSPLDAPGPMVPVDPSGDRGGG